MLTLRPATSLSLVTVLNAQLSTKPRKADKSQWSIKECVLHTWYFCSVYFYVCCIDSRFKYWIKWLKIQPLVIARFVNFTVFAQQQTAMTLYWFKIQRLNRVIEDSFAVTRQDYKCRRPEATSVGGRKLLVYADYSGECAGPSGSVLYVHRGRLEPGCEAY